MVLQRRWSKGLRLGTLISGVLLLTANAAAQSPQVTYNPAADSVVLEYFLDVSEIADEVEDMEARVRIFGDGTVNVHFPAYMTRSGDYRMKFSAGELQAFLESLAAHGLFEFDETAARAGLSNAKAQKAQLARSGAPGALRARSNDVTTILRVNLASYAPTGSTQAAPNVTKDLVWYGLKSDAEDHPEVPGLSGAAAAVDAIAALAEHPALAKVE